MTYIRRYYVWIDILILGNTVTVMSPEGKPIQVNASALQAAAAQNTVGRSLIYNISIFQRI